MLVRRAQMFPVECVVRAYLSGSGWKDYQATGAICGIPLPAGLRESDRLPEPIFTPAAKINTGGHDENISFDTVVAHIGAEARRRPPHPHHGHLQKASAHAASQRPHPRRHQVRVRPHRRPDHPRRRGPHPRLLPLLARHIPTRPAAPQPSFDKQFVRDYLETIHWNKQAPAPTLPDDVIRETRAKYLEAFTLITGRTSLDTETRSTFGAL